MYLAQNKNILYKQSTLEVEKQNKQTTELTRSVMEEAVKYDKVINLRNGCGKFVMFVQKWEKFWRWSINGKMTNIHRLDLTTIKQNSWR